jgi:hypothetical protein
MNDAAGGVEGMADSDTLNIGHIILSHLLTAIRTAEKDAPLELLGTGIPFGKSVSWYGQPGKSGGYILLPRDFLRLVVFQMSDWAYPLTELISPSDDLYALQGSRYPGIRGCPQKPVAALTNTSVGMTLEFWSCEEGAGASIKQASYLPEPQIVDGKVRIPEDIKRAVVYYAAYLSAATLGDEQAATYKEEYNKQLQNITI